MKIAFIIYDLTNGGAEKVVSLLSKELSKDNEVKIIVFDVGIDYEYGGDIINLKIPSKNGKCNKFINIVKRAFSLKKIFYREKFDKIFSFMESASIPSLLVSDSIIVSIRNNPKKFDKITQFIIRKLYKKSKKIVVNSEENKIVLEKEFNLKNVCVLYNPIDISSIECLSLEEIDINYDYIISVGRLHYQKGFDMLIDAYDNCKIKKRCKLLIFGEGLLETELEKQIISLNLQNSIYLMGRTSNPYHYLKNANFFVLSSRYEGFPNVLLEALTCKTPSISFDCKTGPSEIIKHKFNGLLVPANDISKMSEAMDELYFNRELNKKLSDNSIDSIKHLDINNISNQWIELV